jgi:hypothetical protein
MSDPFDYDVNDAFYGLLGEYVRRTEETVEIDSLTHLTQVATVAGTAIGPRAAIQGGHSPHHANLYTLVIGDSGIGKGVSWELAAQFGEAIDPGFGKRTKYDVASTPGLIKLIPDGVYRPSKKRPKEGEEQEYEVELAPVYDKRLLLQIPEMMSVFTSKERDGATLGETLRNAWDGRDLENNAKEQLKATKPHISLVGHITPVDFAKAVANNQRDLRNGFFNRFILVHARNVRLLPFYVPPPDCRELFAKMRESLERLGPVAQPHPAKILDWHVSARSTWSDFYIACKQGTHPFLQGMQGLHSRLAPLAMRVALSHAVFDRADAIHYRHLIAAKSHVLAAYASSQHLFGHALRSPHDLVAVLRASFSDRHDEWITTDLHTVTGKRFSADDLTKAANHLVQAGDWQSREGKKGNGHAGIFFRLARSSEARAPQTIAGPPCDHACDSLPEDTPPFADEVGLADTACEDLPKVDEPPQEEEDKTDPSVFLFDGIRLRMVTPFRVPRDAEALSMDDRPTGLKGNKTGFLVAIADDATEEQRARGRALLDKKPHHVLGSVDGDLLFLKKRSLEIGEVSLASA